MQTKHDRIRDGNTEIRILHKISEILVYNTSGHQIFHHIQLISWTKARDNNNVFAAVLTDLSKAVKGYLRYKTIFCHEVALDV